MACFVPDSNVFLLCRPLDEVDWTKLTADATVELIVVVRVCLELDRQEGRQRPPCASHVPVRAVVESTAVKRIEASLDVRPELSPAFIAHALARIRDAYHRPRADCRRDRGRHG